MLRSKTAAAIFVSTLLTAGPASAMTIQNMGDKDFTVTLDHGVKEEKLMVPVGKTVSTACDETCGVRVIDGQSSRGVMAKTGDSLAIRDGEIAWKKAEGTASN